MSALATGQPFVRPDVRLFLDFLNAQTGPKMSELSPAEARAMMAAMGAIAELETGALAIKRDLSCPGSAGDIPLRLYDARAVRGAGPVFVFIHGGGWVIGDRDIYDSFCAEMARQLDIPVVSVEYRLAPEHPWPAAPDDCEAAARWIATSPAALGHSVTGLAIGGDSAGGNLAIITAMALRDTPAAAPVLGQLPIYPATDMESDHPSYHQFAEGHLLTRESMDWFGACYAADRADRRASPIRFDQSGMPPTLVITASLDPIRDQGRAYAAALTGVGVPVIFREAVGTIHGFITLRKALPSAQADVTAMLSAFRALLDEAVAAPR